MPGPLIGPGVTIGAPPLQLGPGQKVTVVGRVMVVEEAVGQTGIVEVMV